MQRREFTGMLFSLAGASALSPLAGSAASVVKPSFFEDRGGDTGLPGNLPANIKQLVRNVLRTEYKGVNTDWDGTIQVEGLLRFARRGYKEGLDYAARWFDYHVENDGKLTDEEYFKQYDGPKARILREGPLTFVLYSANLGVAFPVHELYQLNKSPIAKRVCFDVADAILHYAARDRFGMLGHDDYNFTDFAIPDTAYWATRANAIAASLSHGDVAGVYWKQSIYQLDQGIRYFFDKEKGLVRTGLFKGEPAATYWCRSQGWLLWAIAGLLRYLPPAHPSFKAKAAVMRQIADGCSRHQSAGGALHVLVDDASSPEEVTGIAMVVAAVKEGMRKGWIPPDYHELCNKGWDFIRKSVDAEGKVHNAYTGWAVTAEEKKVDLMDKNFRGFVPGIIMVAADEMTK